MKLTWLVLLTFSFSFLSSAAFANRPIRGHYEVPVTDDLKPYANYPVKFKADTYNQNPNILSFPMPSALLGEVTTVTLSKADGNTNQWDGDNVNATCETVDRYFKCSVKFDSVSVDQTKLEAAIRQQYQTQGEINARLKVAREFGSEPIGIIIYKLRGSDGNN